MDEDEFYKMKYKPITKKRRYSTYVTQFTNGQIKTGCSDQISFTAYGSKNKVDCNEKDMPDVIVASTERLDYVGKSINAEGNNKCKFHVCVVNRRTKKMKIYDTDIYQFKPIIEQVAQIDSREKKELSYVAKLDELTNAFGSKKKQRAVKSRHMYEVDNTVMEEVLTSAAQNVSVVNEIENNSENNTIFVLPPQNKKATTETEVYNLADIIGDDEYLELEEEGMKLQNASPDDIENWQKDSTYCNYVLHYLNNKKSDLSLHSARLLVFYDYMIQLYKLKYADLRKRDILPDIPNLVKSSIMKKFLVISEGETGAKRKSMPPRMKDKLIAHALIVSLFIDEFTVNLDIFQKDFRISVSQMNKIVYAVGCHILNQNQPDKSVKYACLTIPLNVPQPRYFKLKNSRK